VFSALTGKNKHYFTRLDCEEAELNNVFKETLVDGHIKYYVDDTAITDSHIDYLVKMDSDSPLYMYFPTTYERNCNIWVQDEKLYQQGSQPMDYAGQFFVGDNYSIFNIGHYTKGSTLRVRVTVDNKDNEAFWKDYIFCSFDYDAFEKDCQMLKENAMKVTKFEDTFLEAEAASTQDGQYLFTTIPYEDGWTITVNGTEVKYEKVVESLIAIPLEKGNNTITFRFMPKYLIHSYIITGFGVVLLILVFIVEIRKINVSAKISKLFGSAAVKIEDAISADDEDQDDVDETSTGDETGPDNDTDTDAEVDPPDNESSAADDTNEHQDEH
jgi:uncharacterized membrane protein YfhO